MNTNETNPEFFNENSNDNHEIVTHDPRKKNNKKIIIITISTILAILLIIGMVFGIIAAVGGKKEQYPIGNGDKVFNTKSLGEITEIYTQETYEEENSDEGKGWKISRNLKTENLAKIIKGTLDSNCYISLVETNNFNELFTQYASSIHQHYEESIKADYLFYEKGGFHRERYNVTNLEINIYLKNFTYLLTHNNQVVKEISIDNLAYECLLEIEYEKQLLNWTIVENVNNLKVNDKAPLSFNLKVTAQELLPSRDFDEFHYEAYHFYDKKFHFNFI